MTQFQDLSGVSVNLVESLDDAMAFKRWLGERREILAVDTETGGFHWWRDPLRLVQFGDALTGWSIPFGDWAGLVKEATTAYEGEMVAHNMKFDLHYLERNGVPVRRHSMHDTRAMAHLLDPVSSTGLKPLSNRMIHPRATAGEALLKSAMMQRKWTWATVPVDFGPYWQYGALDTVLTARLYSLMRPRLTAGGLDEVYDVERGSTIALLKMEQRGARIDLDYVAAKSRELSDYAEQVAVWARGTFGVENVNSSAQVWRALQAAGIEPKKFTGGGKPRLDEEVLSSIDHPLAKAVLSSKRAKKIVSSYFDTLLELADGDLIHCSTNPLGARTGRMSISDPPLQQLPRGPLVRGAFIARERHRLGLVDWDQMELRVFAHYAKEEAMIQAIRAGIDLHTFIAAEVFGNAIEDVTADMRQITKGVNFGLIYGAGPDTIASTSGQPIDAVNRFLAGYHARFPGVKRFFRELEHEARARLAEEGVAYVRTWLGRRQPADKDKLYTLSNYLIQGGCADLLKRKLVDMDAAGLGDYLILPIHDELIGDFPVEMLPDAAHEMQEIMTETQLFSVPLSASADIYDGWGDKYAVAS